MADLPDFLDIKIGREPYCAPFGGWLGIEVLKTFWIE